MRVGKLAGRVALITTCIVTGACQPPPVYDVTQGNVANSKNKIDQAEAKQYPPPAPVITQSGAYVDTKKISLIKPPAWLKQQVTLHGGCVQQITAAPVQTTKSKSKQVAGPTTTTTCLPFTFYVNQVLGDTEARVTYDASIDKAKTIPIDYSGTIQGALDQIASHTGYHYHIDYVHKPVMVSWTAYRTKTFDISFIPGASKFQVGKSQGSAGESNGIAGSSVSGFDTADEQYSNLMGDVSVWTEIEKTITSILGGEGTVNTSLATTTVTVQAPPAKLAMVSRYLAKMNRELSRQVRLQVQIIEVQLSNDFAYGIDWNLVKKVGEESFSLVSPGFNDVNSINDAALGAAQLIFKPTDPNSQWFGSNTVIAALEQQGQVRVLTQPTIVTLNNQVAQLAVQDMENYVKEIAVVLNETQSETSVMTDTLSTGMMLYLLPKIQDNNIFLQVSSNLSRKVALTSFDTGSGTVQLPNITQRLANQRAVMPSGGTLVLSGFKSLEDSNANNKMFDVEALGGKAANKESLEILILITPSILINEQASTDVNNVDECNGVEGNMECMS